MNFFRNLFKKKEKILVKEQDNVRMEFDVTDENNPKPIKATISFNVLGETMSFDYDFSKEAEEKRKIDRALEKEKSWTKESGDRLNWAEKELIGEYSARKKYSQNGLYCVVFVKEIVKKESTGKGRFWLVDCTNRTILFDKEPNIIDEIFVLNDGRVVFDHFIRQSWTHYLTVYNSAGALILNKRKKVAIQLDDVNENGVIKGHFLDKKYSEFIIEL